ncbi:Protein fmp52-1, mitochondrial [Cytospora mali]|uniref:Protein fmp52-1, mitochondrial n=1 Tax=Cytospora mali TaxID=578113 RepID=A0A194UUE9_CYTMA|nr:Protein fmp52-1, mitochondrial [Valsa mali var. pyri (nom. inval.)]
MKVAIGGSTGFVGTELVRQALAHPAITAVVGLSRRDTPVPPGSEANATKLTSVVCNDFETYSQDVKKELHGTDACIWTIAVTPSKQNTLPFDDVCRISRDYAVTAIKALASGPREHGQPFRFIYVSGIGARRDRAEAESDKFLVERGLVEYCLMRGDAESQILTFADKSSGEVEASVARPGLIHGPGKERRTIAGVPYIELHELAAALLDQVMNGVGKDTMMHDDLVQLGQKAHPSEQ